MDPHSRAAKEKTSHDNEVLPTGYYASYTKDHVTNEGVRAKMMQSIGPHEDLLTIVS